MENISYYRNRALEKLREKLFIISSHKIRATKSIATKDSGEVIIVTQLHKKAFDMALIALKSFILRTKINALHIINDGSLSEHDISTLKQHFTNFKMVNFEDIEMGNTPRGGTWERLCYISSLCADHYVIQLDSDTITINTPFDILNNVKNNIPFIIGNGPVWDKRVQLEDVAADATLRSNTHVQTLTESKLEVLSTVGLKTYIRGCSAVTGFSKGSRMFDKIQKISQLMERELGKSKWLEWGSEQVCCSIALSLCEDTQILRWPVYQNYKFPEYINKTKIIEQQISLIHFIGSNRFSDRVYENLSKNFIKSIS